MKRKITLVLFSFVMIFTFVFAIGSIKNDKTLALTNWSVGSGITSSTESGEEVFITNSSTCELTYTGDLTGTQGINTISADFCYTGNGNTDWENVGFRLGCSTKYYNVNVWPNTASNGPAVLMIQQDSQDPINRFLDMK